MYRSHVASTLFCIEITRVHLFLSPFSSHASRDAFSNTPPKKKLHWETQYRANGRFATATTSSAARRVTEPVPNTNTLGLTPRSPSIRHTPLPGAPRVNAPDSPHPSPLSQFSSPYTESPVLLDNEDLPEDLQNSLDYSQETYRPDQPSSAEAEARIERTFYSEQGSEDEFEHTSIIVTHSRAPSEPAPEPQSPALSTTIPTGPAPPPLGYAAASAMGSTSATALEAARKEVHALRQFDDGESPITEAEYRYGFITATEGLTDEEKARMWVLNLKYKGVAFRWYNNLIKTQEGKKAAKKWSTLESEIEKRWETPADDEDEALEKARIAFREHKLTMESIIGELMEPTMDVRPHVKWAIRHKSLAAQLDSHHSDLVDSTLNNLPTCVIRLLPQRRRYGKDFTLLMKHILEIDTRDLIEEYADHYAIYTRPDPTAALLEQFRDLSVTKPPKPAK
ncbi:hypothetical protein RSAG8_12104, partial [Rhizoctonia solani AG-8 WAC10335]